MLTTSRNAVGNAQAEANTRILEAAPDLLAALKGLFDAEVDYQSQGSEDAAYRIDTYLTKARAAIAKAEAKP